MAQQTLSKKGAATRVTPEKPAKPAKVTAAKAVAAPKQVEDHFIQTLAVGESSGVQGKKSRVQVTEAVRPTITDWDKFYAYIKKNNAFELLNRAPNRVAITERWDAKKQIPGVGSFHDKKVSCTKLSGK
jgi:hypothetical protein